MTPKERAEELVIEYQYNGIFITDIRMDEEEAIECALICVDKLIDCLPSVNGRPPNYQTINKYTSEYWKEVKQEINKL